MMQAKTMKKLVSLLTAAVMTVGLLPAAVSAAETAENEDYEIRVATFEGSDWDALIDSPQYGGPLLYGSEGMGRDTPYEWYDAETGLYYAMKAANSYGPAYCYWSYGEAISNYASGEIETYGGFDSQLTVYKEGVTGVARTGGGHNGSNNFVVHYGYADTSGFGLGEAYLPELSFPEGPRVIDHMYVKLTTYLLNCITNGNGLTASMGDDDILYLRAIGYDADGKKTGEVKMNVCEGQNLIVKDWTKWDLSGLGKVSSVALEINGSSDNGYGFSQPAYFAFDDVAVRVEKSADQIVTGLIDAIGTVTEESGDAITAARSAYDALTDDQKALVENYEVLEAAEARYTKLTNVVKLALTGEEKTHAFADSVSYTLSAKDMMGLNSIELTIAVNGDLLTDVKAEAAAEGWYIIAQTYENGVLSLVAGNNIGADGDGDLLTITGKPVGKGGEAKAEVTHALLAGYDGDGEAWIKVNLDEAQAVTQVIFNRYDVNHDGVVNLLDVTRAQRYYGEYNEVCDVNDDGEVNIADLVLILNNYFFVTE